MIRTFRQPRCRTRFAPSPTGSMHIGNLRTAFYAYALAKHNGGDFILRIEDTDKKREAEGGTDEIKKLLIDFNIKWDEYYVQSERLALYKDAAEKLVKNGYAFYCQCPARNASQSDAGGEADFSDSLRDPCRDKNLTLGAIKLKVPENEVVSFKDYVLNETVEWKTSDVFDATLLKTDGFPTYHLASVVDDHNMKISHVLRGHDWMPSTPIHLLVYKALGYQLPEIGHLTDILDPEGGKLSKRKGSTSTVGLMAEGYLPEALFNFVILLGWAPKDNQELFNLGNFIKAFDNKGFQKANPIFNHEKLDWFNGYYIRQKSDDELCQKFENFSPEFGKLNENWKLKIVNLVKDRIKKISDINEFAKFFWETPKVDVKLFGENYKEHLSNAVSIIESVKDWKLETLNEKFMEVIKAKGYKTGDFFMSLRIAVTGSKFTPPINDSIAIMDKSEVLSRLQKVLQ